MTRGLFCSMRLRAMLAPHALALVTLLGACATPAPPPAVIPAPVAVMASQPMAAPEPAPPTVEAPPPAVEAPQTPPAPPGPRGRLDPLQDAERADLWQRVRDGYTIPPLDNELVRRWEQYYASKPEYMQRITERGSRYLFHIVEEIERREMPVDLALLPFIESAFNPQADSRARASGLWQFMPATGRDYELEQNLFRDDRRSVLDSTRAALDYLKRLHGMFGDWHLALAAYNWGQGNVKRELQRNRNEGLPLTYDALRMPIETRNYVPKLQAVKNIVARPQAFATVLPPLYNHPYFVSVAIERDIDVALAARLAGLPLADFQALNPQMNKPVILAAGTPLVLLPYDSANRFLAGIAGHQGPMATWTTWVAPRAVKPAEAAKLVGMPEAELRDVNRIPSGMLVLAGSTLVVPRAAHVQGDVTGRAADDARMVLSPEQRAARETAFRAGRKGDTVVAVARRHGLTPTQVAHWNGVATTARFKPGQRIVLMKTTAPKASAKAAVRTSGKAATAARAARAAPKTLKKAPTKAPSKKSSKRAQRPK